jgi:lauroyl/myristoyl acyltransferase
MMPLDRAALRLIYLRRVVVTLANTIGPQRSLAIARWLARGVFDLSPPARQRAEANIALAFGDELTVKERGRLTRRMFENFASFWVEAFVARRKLRPGAWRKVVQFDDEPFLRRIAESRRGALFVTAYFGNFAIGAYALGQLCRPLYVVIDELEHPVLKSWQQDLYRQPNIELLPREGARRSLADLLSAGEKVLLVGEHLRPRGKAIEVRYLGAIRRCYPTIGLLAGGCDVPVVVVGTRRLEGAFRFSISSRLAVDPRDLRDDGEPDLIPIITLRCMQTMETMIRQWPEQYLWTRVWDSAKE